MGMRSEMGNGKWVTPCFCDPVFRGPRVSCFLKGRSKLLFRQKIINKCTSWPANARFPNSNLQSQGPVPSGHSSVLPSIGRGG